MKLIKIMSVCLVSVLVVFGSYKASKIIIENMNSRYVPKNSVVHKKASNSNNEIFRENQDVDNMMFHSVNGTGETTLPVKYDKNFIIYQNKFYVTSNKGKTWMQVPNDNSLGYAQISEYENNISESNIYTANNKTSIVYGGRGSENISIMTSDDNGKLWGVNSISKTATHDLKNGYDKLYIDFLSDGKTGYIVSIRKPKEAQKAISAYSSVDTGVTWQKIDKEHSEDVFYNKIITHFGL